MYEHIFIWQNNGVPSRTGSLHQAGKGVMFVPTVSSMWLLPAKVPNMTMLAKVSCWSPTVSSMWLLPAKVTNMR
jgi:hypothetical protein